MAQSRNSTASVVIVTPDQPPARHSRSYRSDHDPLPAPAAQHNRTSQLSTRNTMTPNKGASLGKSQPSPIRRSSSSDSYHGGLNGGGVRFYGQAAVQHLPPIPGSPDVTDHSTPPSPVSRKSTSSTPVNGESSLKPKESPNGKASPTRKSNVNMNSSVNGGPTPDSISRARTKSSPYVQHRSPAPQSLSAAVELLTSSEKQSVSDSSHGSIQSKSINGHPYSNHRQVQPSTPVKERKEPPPSPRRPAPTAPTNNFWRSVSSSSVAGKEISRPIPNHGDTSLCR